MRDHGTDLSHGLQSNPRQEMQERFDITEADVTLYVSSQVVRL